MMVAEQKEIREREMMEEQMSRGRSSTSITGKLVSALLPSLYSRHSSDSGFHSRRGEERVKMGNGGVELFVTDSRPPSLQVSRSASRAESVGSSIFSSDCLEVQFFSMMWKSYEPVSPFRMSLSPVLELFLVVMSQNPIGWGRSLARVPSQK